MTDTPPHPGSRPWRYDGAEIMADGVVHVAGLVLAFAGSVALLAAGVEASAATLSRAVYCTTLLVTLSASAAYNLWPVSPLKWRLRRLDHAMIFGLIAGTYTPFLTLVGSTGTTLLLAAIWTLSLLGIALKLADVGRREWLSTLLYIALGWSGLAAGKTLLARLPVASIVLVVVGGVLYSVGSLFHHWRALRFQNAIWHGFVLAAASCHYAAVAAAA